MQSSSVLSNPDILKEIIDTEQLTKSDEHSKDKIVIEPVSARAARSPKAGEKAPLIVSIPRSIADKFNLEAGETLLMVSDGNKIVITRPVIPKL